MKAVQQAKLVRILFDEFHSESWTISAARAAEIQPANPGQSSYRLAADALAVRDFEVRRHTEGELTARLLADVDVLVLPHPCDPKWEPTTSPGPPMFSPDEIRIVHEFVRRGGGLIVISEYEHDKYGNNLNELLAPFGLAFENTTVQDRAHCVHENPTWIMADPKGHAITHLARRICFYRAGSVQASGAAFLALRATENAIPEQAGLIGLGWNGEGRVAALSDSSFLGDQRFGEFDHEQLWLNLVYWCAAAAFRQHAVDVLESAAARLPEWRELKAAVNELRQLQSPDGSVEAASQALAASLVESLRHRIGVLGRFYTHQHDYLRQVDADLEAWVRGGFGKPDFEASLAAFNPQDLRSHHLELLVVFPLYTPNASKDTRFDALIMRVPWPEWLAKLEREAYQNPKFVPGHLVDYTEGYHSECAVLFPETVSVASQATNNFAVIFCDREAKRLQATTAKAAQIVGLDLHPQLECWLSTLALIQDTNALWDLIHDKSHSVGELPFDPFMIRQRAPFWMYALEELRVDLRSFCEAARLASEGFPFARYVTYAVLCDRIFRFPISGTRVRNYDALGGQLLFSFLHKRDVLVWRDNRLTIRWEALLDAVGALRAEITQLYRDGADVSRVAFWIEAHDLISKYLQPNVASRWKKDGRAVMDERDPRRCIELVHEDEFPLGGFHQHLLKKMSLPLG